MRVVVQKIGKKCQNPKSESDKKDADHVDGTRDKKRSKDKNVESDDSYKVDTNYEGKVGGRPNSSKVSRKVVENVVPSP